MKKLSLDFETRSHVDLKRRGLYNYAADKTTDFICLAFFLDGDEKARVLFAPWASKVLKREKVDAQRREELLDALARAEAVTAYNAGFERAIWRYVMTRYGYADIPLERWHCTAAHANSYALPQNLGELAKALGVPEQKDSAGATLIRQLSVPDKKTGQFCEAPALLRDMGRYCAQDVLTERAVLAALPPFNESEREIWLLDQRVNDRGVAVDVEGCRKLEAMVDRETKRLGSEIGVVTGGEVNSSRQVDASLKWLANQGVVLPDLTKASVTEALAGPLPEKAARFLAIRQSEGLSSVAKFGAFERFTCSDGRLRGMFRYHGASTGRWAGQGVQPQNFPRDTYKTSEEVEAVIAGKVEGCPIQAAAKALRGMFVAPPGGKLLAMDFAAIEGRVLAWLAEESAVVDAYREGKDLYLVAVSNIYGFPYRDLTKDHPLRPVGKVAELALGYQGWTGAFAAMAKGYGVNLLGPDDREWATKQWNADLSVAHPLEEERIDRLKKMFHSAKGYIDALEQSKAAGIIKEWRKNRPNTVSLWAGLNSAALAAVKNPGKAFQYGRIKFCVKHGFLLMRLPSGRCLAYHQPEVEVRVDKYERERETITYMEVDSYSRKWSRSATYGGKLTENAVQAIARDVLCRTLLELDFLGFDIVMHVHDEVVVELSSEADERKAFEVVHRAASTPPDWAHDLPLGAEGWISIRYKK